jgi:hypothetical protein
MGERGRAVQGLACDAHHLHGQKPLGLQGPGGRPRRAASPRRPARRAPRRRASRGRGRCRAAGSSRPRRWPGGSRGAVSFCAGPPVGQLAGGAAACHYSSRPRAPRPHPDGQVDELRGRIVKWVARVQVGAAAGQQHAVDDVEPGTGRGGGLSRIPPAIRDLTIRNPTPAHPTPPHPTPPYPHHTPPPPSPPPAHFSLISAGVSSKKMGTTRAPAASIHLT